MRQAKETASKKKEKENEKEKEKETSKEETGKATKKPKQDNAAGRKAPKGWVQKPRNNEHHEYLTETQVDVK